ncbi:MAG: replication-associated recombination protein A, partial [Gammaproteobacteria bacterium]|nr:replication-associated recombination protein A [Gammaproteobacteria bacterium]
MSDLFTEQHEFQPLAARMRPRTLDEYIGQQHLVGSGKPLRRAIEQGKLHSMILWGPPGTGKTTLANLMAAQANAVFEKLSAVLSGVKEIRNLVDIAEANLAQGKATLVFVDEVHRFNKAQQDAFLPHVEAGTFTFIGATTENPSFALNNALLSRARVYVLKSLTAEDMLQVIQQALNDEERGVGHLRLDFPLELQQQLAEYADGDARTALNLLEIISELALNRKVTTEILQQVTQDGVRRFDKGGEEFYNQISALHKSVRGSDPDAALYWFARMIDGGCDSLYIARRVVRMASEDIGNADPRALTLALDAWEVQERLGSP